MRLAILLSSLRSATFRLTLAYLGVFGLSAIALLAFVYEASVGFMEQQTRDTIEAEIQGLREQYLLGALPALKRAIDRRAEAERNRASIYLLVTRDGDWIAGNIDRWPEAMASEDGTLLFTFERRRPDGEGNETRHALARAFVVAERYQLLVGRDVEDRINLQRLLLHAVVTGAGLILVIGVLGGFALSRWTLGRLEGINRATRLIMSGDLSRRIALDGSGDEFDELAANLNRMLERIEELVRAMREVTDNIAHDLRTPLTRMRSRLELALMRPLDAAEARDLLEETMREADHLIATFNALLAIARAESGTLEADRDPVDLSEIAADVFDLYEPFAEERQIALELRTGGPVAVRGQRHLLAQAVANLVDNAVKYTEPGGRVWILTETGPPPAIEVADNGPGIPEDQRARALERFVRLAPERSAPGNGLGLSLVDAVARLHRARLTLDDNRPGLKVRLEFPPEGVPAPRSKALPPAGTEPRSP
ncbi:Sensor kinase CusS [bacterium HR40]|nr:Sensor kinase CusS [bacterium HR40]